VDLHNPVNDHAVVYGSEAVFMVERMEAGRLWSAFFVFFEGLSVSEGHIIEFVD
jgi:hypothetical protein